MSLLNIATLKVWNTYLLRLEYLQKKHRIQNWLRENDGAVQICPIDLGISERKNICKDTIADVYQYLSACKQFPIDWQDKRTYYRPTATILDLNDFSDFDGYLKAVSKKSVGNDNRSVKKALRLGYRTRIIDQDAYGGSIDRIRRSKLFRSGGGLLSGGLVLDAILPPANFVDSSKAADWAPCCENHWSICWGVFKGNMLVAYAVLIRGGNIIRAIQTMGHRDALRDGVVKLLMFDIIRWLYERDTVSLNGIRHFIYGVLEHGKDGLLEWKLRLQFKPSLVDMTQAEKLSFEFDEATDLA